MSYAKHQQLARRFFTGPPARGIPLEPGLAVMAGAAGLKPGAA